MNAIYIIAMQTVRQLIRDRIYLPTIVTAALVAYLCSIVSEFSIEEMTQIYANLSLTAFSLTGAIVALFWGSKIILEATQEGVVDIQITGGTTRTRWFIGKVVGLSITLVSLSLVFCIIWVGILTYNQYGEYKPFHLTIFLFFSVYWICLGCLSLLLGTLASHGVAMFTGLGALVVGLLAEPVSRVVSEQSPLISKWLAAAVMAVWNLSYFDLKDYAVLSPPSLDLGARLAYGIGLILGLTGLGCFVFRTRDIR